MKNIIISLFLFSFVCFGSSNPENQDCVNTDKVIHIDWDHSYLRYESSNKWIQVSRIFLSDGQEIIVDGSPREVSEKLNK